MKKKPKDRHLDIPSEANRDKHINFAALEADDKDPADYPPTGKLAESKERENKEQQDKSRQSK